MQVGWLHKKTLPIALAIATSLFWFQGVCTELVATAALIWVAQTPLKTEDKPLPIANDAKTVARCHSPCVAYWNGAWHPHPAQSCWPPA